MDGPAVADHRSGTRIGVACGRSAARHGPVGLTGGRAAGHRWALGRVAARYPEGSRRGQSAVSLLGADGKRVSTLGVVPQGGMAAVGPDCGLSDVVLSCAGPAEVHARLRLLTARTTTSPRTGTIRLGDLTVDEDAYTARLKGRMLQLAFQGIRAAQIPRPASRAGLDPAAIVDRGVGFDF